MNGMQKVYFQNARKEKLAGILYKPEKEKVPCVVICHGLGSSKDNKAPIMEAFAQAGIASLAFDFNGHGESEGAFEELTLSKAVGDAKAALDFASSLDVVDRNKIGLGGHSFGGSVSLVAAGEDKRIRALAVSAPPTDFLETMKMLSDYDTRIGNIDVWKRKGFTHYYSLTQGRYMKLKYPFFEDAVKYDAKNIAKGIRCPVLIIHGNKDRVVPLKQSEILFQMLNAQKELKILDCGHAFEEKDLQDLINLSKDWFLKWL